MARLEREPLSAVTSPRQQALIGYAIKLTIDPASVTPADTAALRDAGLSDEGIHAAAAITAYFCFVNRIALGLGVELEPQLEK